MLTLSRANELFLTAKEQAVQLRGLSARSLREYAGTCDQLLVLWGGRSAVASLTPEDFDRFVSRELPLATSSRWAMRSTALSGAVALALIVNIIELPRTAGLPALYAQILKVQNLPLWKNYAYQALGILAYILDDASLVAIVVTLKFPTIGRQGITLCHDM